MILSLKKHKMCQNWYTHLVSLGCSLQVNSPIKKNCHLTYGITQCYLPPDTSEHTAPYLQPDRLVLDLSAPEGWKAELT